MPSRFAVHFSIPVASAVVACAMMVAASGAPAQDVHAERNTTPPSPQSMAGDYFDIPQSAQLKVPLGPPAGPNAQAAHRPAATVNGIGFKLAAIAAQAAEQSCAKDGYAVTVAVTDLSLIHI